MDEALHRGVDEVSAFIVKVSYLPTSRSHFHRFAHCSQQTLNNGLIAIVDAQKCSWRLARDQMKLITQILDKNLIKLFAIRTEAFSMQNCAKTYKKGEVRRLDVFREIGFECYACLAVVTR